MLKAAVIGGDRRFTSLIHTLQSHVDHLYTIGFADASFNENVHEVSLDDVPFEEISAILLPVQGISDKGGIKLLDGREITLSESHVNRTKQECIVLTGVITPFIREKIQRKVISWMNRQDVAIANSIPTAEGCLQLAIENTSHTIHGSSVCVLGYGRCGQTIADVFRGVGANVTVSTIDEVEEARAKQRGFTTLFLKNAPEWINQYEICINTIPAYILTPEVFRKMKPTCYTLDISSSPGAFKKEEAEKFKQDIVNVPGLPGRVAPHSAGVILADATRKILVKEFGDGA